MNKKAIFRILLSVVILIVAGATCRMGFSGIQNANWLLLLVLLLSINFVREVRKSIRGETISWDYLTMRDKLIFAACTIVLLIFILYPIMEDMPIGAFLISTLIGIALTWFIASKFGSEALNEFLYSN